MGRLIEEQTFGDVSEIEAPSGRQSGRAKIASSATLSWTEPGQRFHSLPAIAIDRSGAGYGFRLQQAPANGQRVQVDLPPARRYWGTVRHVTWVNGAYNVGVELDPEPLDAED